MAGDGMNEQQVRAVFVRHLLARGWDVTTDDDTAVTARRGAERLVAESTSATGSIGTDVDTVYGQLLRRIEPTTDDSRFALVAHETTAAAVTRVHPAVRKRLGIEVWLVSDLGGVRLVEE